MLVYKIDILAALKESGYTTTRIRKEKLLNESAVQYLRKGKPLGPVPLNQVCKLLHMQPGDIIQYVDE